MPASEQEWIQKEAGKLERQLQDEAFLKKAPTDVVERARTRLAKLQEQLAPKEFEVAVFDEGQYGYRWKRTWWTEIWVVYPDPEVDEEDRPDAPYDFGVMFEYKTRQACDKAWKEITEFWVDPKRWVLQIRQREQQEEERKEYKQYLKLKKRFENAKPDSTETCPLE